MTVILYITTTIQKIMKHVLVLVSMSSTQNTPNWLINFLESFRLATYFFSNTFRGFTNKSVVKEKPKKRLFNPNESFYKRFFWSDESRSDFGKLYLIIESD